VKPAKDEPRVGGKRKGFGMSLTKAETPRLAPESESDSLATTVNENTSVLKRGGVEIIPIPWIILSFMFMM